MDHPGSVGAINDAGIVTHFMSFLHSRFRLNGEKGPHWLSALLGGIVIAGVALEEVVEKFVSSYPVLAPFAAIATPLIVGSLTAIAMSLVAYLIDRSFWAYTVRGKSFYLHATGRANGSSPCRA